MRVNSIKKIKASWKRPIFYHWMTAPLFNAGTYHFTNIRSLYTLDTCPKNILMTWLLLQGVQDNNSYHNQRRWLLYEGHRKHFNKLAATQLLLPVESMNEEDKKKMDTAHQLIHIVPPATIMAFDFALLIALNRVGERLNLLGKKEAASSNMEAVDSVQSNYTSWYEFHSGCIAGTYFRHPLNDTSTLLPFYTKNLLYFSSPPSPIPWNYDF